MSDEGRARLRDFAGAGFAAAGVPGLVLQVVDTDGVVETITWGELAADAPVLLGSTSKSVTAIALLQAVEAGMLRLDDSVREWLPEVDLPAEVTIRDLAHHCSGLAADSTPRRHRHRGDRGFHYANQNYNLLGAVIAEATGMPFEKWIASRLTTPLGLGNTFCAGCDRDEQITPGHVGLFGHFVPTRLADYGADAWIQPASGAICASACDAGTMLRMLLNEGCCDGTRVLSAASVRRLLTDTVPADSSPAIDGPLGESGDYAFGWVRKVLDGDEVFLHVGKVPDYTTVFALIPGRGLGLVLASSGADFLVSTPLIEDLADGAIRLLLGHPVPPMSAATRKLNRFIVTTCYLGFTGVAAVGWLGAGLPRPVSGRMPEPDGQQELGQPGSETALAAHWLFRLGYYLVFPLAVLYGARRLSQTPVRWLWRFVPDASAVLSAGAVSMVVSGMVRCLVHRRDAE